MPEGFSGEYENEHNNEGADLETELSFIPGLSMDIIRRIIRRITTLMDEANFRVRAERFDDEDIDRLLAESVEKSQEWEPPVRLAVKDAIRRYLETVREKLGD